ncbi:hypothetical protein QL285_074942 [Trifolium repens]|nr:hypothetical protein QL285_074942 [Trifolium repens]
MDQLDLIGGLQFIFIELLEIIAEKFDTIISSFTHLDKEFCHMIEITKSHKLSENMDAALQNGFDLQAKHSWVTLHSLLHSERISYRQNGYIWLGDLLIAEISEERDGNIRSNEHEMQLSNSKDLEHGKKDWHLEKANAVIDIMSSALSLVFQINETDHEHEMQLSNSKDLEHGKKDWYHEKANAVIDIMSSALSLVFQINETDRINILKFNK